MKKIVVILCALALAAPATAAAGFFDGAKGDAPAVAGGGGWR